MSKTYVFNKETQKIELHFSKEEYQALSEELKRELKSAYLFSGKSQAWVSRSTNNHYSAIKVAEKLGFTNKEIIGERLSYAEQIEKQKERAEARAEKYEQYANNAEKRAEELQRELKSYHGDISFFTQPIINGHSGSEAFAKRRERIFNRYKKGFEEYRKSDYFKSKAITAEETASMSKFKDRSYLTNRIKECNSNIKKLESNITHYEDIIYKKENNIELASIFYKEKSIEQIQEYLQDTLEKMEYELDKLAYLQNCLEELGKVYDKSNLKVGYEVKIRGEWEKIIKLNRTTVEVQPLEERIKMYISKRAYSEIEDMRIPADYKEEKEVLENPYKENDILVQYAIAGDRIIRAYQVLKITAKGVQIQEINTENNKPILNSFKVGSKPMRKGIVKSKYSDFIGVYDNGWQLHKYNIA